MLIFHCYVELPEDIISYDSYDMWLCLKTWYSKISWLIIVDYHFPYLNGHAKGYPLVSDKPLCHGHWLDSINPLIWVRVYSYRDRKQELCHDQFWRIPNFMVR